MSAASPFELLVLHGVRLRGFADTLEVADRFGLDPFGTADLLTGYEQQGTVSFARFADLGGWSLTAAGRAENERMLAAELEAADGRQEVQEVHRAFLPWNARLVEACTAWQLRPTDGGPVAENDHSDARWDARILDELTRIEHALGPIAARLGDLLERFEGYDTRFSTALGRARDGRPAWVDGSAVESCHQVWFELHEDLVATLGIDRSAG